MYLTNRSNFYRVLYIIYNSDSISSYPLHLHPPSSCLSNINQLLLSPYPPLFSPERVGRLLQASNGSADSHLSVHTANQSIRRKMAQLRIPSHHPLPS